MTAELNWSAVFPVLGRHFRVAFDQRGHERGLDCAGGYRLEQCADDVAGLAAVLGIQRLIVVGDTDDAVADGAGGGGRGGIAAWMAGLRADLIGTHLLDQDLDRADRAWALGQMRRTPLLTAVPGALGVAPLAYKKRADRRWGRQQAKPVDGTPGV